MKKILFIGRRDLNTKVIGLNEKKLKQEGIEIFYAGDILEINKILKNSYICWISLFWIIFLNNSIPLVKSPILLFI